MKEERKVHWLQIIIAAFVGALFTALFGVLISWVMQSTLSITLATPLKVAESYITSIDIKNFSKKIKNTDLCVSSVIQITEVESSVSYTFDKQNGIITIDKIHPMSSVSLIVKSNSPIEKTNFKVSSDSRTTISYLSEQKSITQTVVLFAVIQFIVSFLYILISISRDEKKRNDQYAVQARETEELKKQVLEVRQSAEINNKRLRWIQAYYNVRFSDYAKELDFWKDTIRRMMYSFGTTKQDGERLLDMVTTSLKTYTTNEKKVRFAELEYIAQRMVDSSVTSQEKV